MKERPILFSAPMVRALLAGKKTQTRRLLKPRHDYFVEDGKAYFEPYVYAVPESIEVPCPYGEPGDRLWVRETWCVMNKARTTCVTHGHHKKPERGWDIVFRADEQHQHRGWRSSLFLPRWASRITLEVTGVRVERVQDISEEDARAEGAEPYEFSRRVYPSKHAAEEVSFSHREGFHSLWNSINGAKSWQANPWVWVVEFNPTGER